MIARRAVLCAALIATASCTTGSELRRQQAEQLRRWCQSIAVRTGADAREVAAIGGRPVESFRVGSAAGPRRAVDVIDEC